MIYKIELNEHLQRVFEIEADSLGEAVERIARHYARKEINLDNANLKDFSIKEHKE